MITIFPEIEQVLSFLVQGIDNDLDMLSSYSEAIIGTNPNYPDTDNDGLYDGMEVYIGINPTLIDTDNDNFLDGYEYEYGSDPLDSSDFPIIWKDDFDTLMLYLSGNWTLLQKVIEWSEGNATLIDNIIIQLEQNATLLQQVIGWLGENANEIDLLFTYLEGNATLLIDVINFLEGNATQIQILNQWYAKLQNYVNGNATLLAKVIIDLNANATLINTVYALATQNAAYLSQINGTLSSSIDDIRAVIDELGISIGDTDYDGLNDLDELSYGTNPAMIDTDLDNLNDAFEIKYGTDPLDDDTDDDGSYDGIEIASGTDPLDPDDYPGKVPPSGGVNIPLLVDTIIGVVSAVSVVTLAGIFQYMKRRKIEN